MPGVRRISARVDAMSRQCRGILAEIQRRRVYNKSVGGTSIEVARSSEKRNPRIYSKDNPLAISEEPVEVARDMIKSSGLEYGQEEIQEFLNNFSMFDDLPMHDYRMVMRFTALIIDHIFEVRGKDTIMTFDLPDTAPVHVIEHYIKRWGNDEGKERHDPNDIATLLQYYRTNLLLECVGAYHSTGTLIINGNLGIFFANEATGGKIILNGECGWRSCIELNGAEVEINGIAGHEFIDGGWTGKVYINDGIVSGRSVPAQVRSLSTHKGGVECYLNGRQIYPSEDDNVAYAFKNSENS